MPEIQIDGLKQFRSQLKQIDANLPKKIRVALNSSSQLVIDYAKPKIPSRTGRARASLKVRSSQTKAAIAAGGTKAPYYPWLDFGGRVGRGNSVKRPYSREGRYVYPGLKANRDEITQTMASALTELAQEAGLEVS